MIDLLLNSFPESKPNVLLFGVCEGPAGNIFFVRFHNACDAKNVLIEFSANPQFSIRFWRFQFPQKKI